MGGENNISSFLDPIAKVWNHSSVFILPTSFKQKKKQQHKVTKNQRKDLFKKSAKKLETVKH